MTNYSVEILILCDYQNKTTSRIEFDPQYLSEFNINKCKNTIVGLSKSGKILKYEFISF